MVNRNWWILGIAGIAVPMLLAQEGRIGGPVSGFAFDNLGHVLRPIRGIPGASIIGEALDFGFEVTSVQVAPRQDSAVVVAADRSLHFFRLASGTAAERAVEGLSGVPERVNFSPSGTAAALYAEGRVRIVKGLPDSPTMAATIDLEGAPTTLAISDDGAYLLSIAANAVRLLGTAGENFKVMDAADGALAVFAPGGHDAAISDSVAGLVWFRDLAAGSQRTALTSAENGVVSPVGLGFSADARKLFVASSAARSVSSFDLQTGGRSTIACDCAPEGLTAMGSTFRLNDLGAEPLWLLDAAASEPRIVFVPAMAQPSANRTRPPARPRGPEGR